LRTFIDNVILLVMEGTLLFELAEIFSPDRVQQLNKNPEDVWLLEALANEPEGVIQKRETETKKQKRLEEALEKFRERLGDSTFNSLKAKFASLSHRTPLPQGEVVPKDIFSATPERRPNISVSRPSSAASNVSGETALSANTTLTVPSPENSPGTGRTGSARSSRRSWGAIKSISDEEF
jgi:hypothetical protein